MAYQILPGKLSNYQTVPIIYGDVDKQRRLKVSPEDAKLLEQRGGKFAQLLPGTTFPGTRVWNWWVPSGKLRELRKPWPMHFYDLPLNMVVFQNSNAMLVLLEAMD
jgi:hypothetical protein